LWRDNAMVPAYGMAPNAVQRGQPHAETPPASLRWTVNCLVCHMAEIDGVAYFGAGTKTFDELWLGEALKRLTSEPWASRLTRGPSRLWGGSPRQPDSQQPPSRQDRLADTREVHRVRRVARRDVHALARQRDAFSCRCRPGRRQDAAAVAHGCEDAGSALVHRRQLSRSVSVDGF